MDDPGIAGKTGIGRVWLAGYLGAMLTAVGAVVIGIPWLFRASGCWSFGLGLLLVAVPLLRRSHERAQTSIRGRVRHYLIELVDTGRRLLTVLAILPSVAAQLLLALGGVLAIALLSMLLVGAVQRVFGVHVEGISDFSQKDLFEAGAWLASTLAAMVLSWLLLRGTHRLAPAAQRVASHADDAIRRWLAARLP